MSTFRKAHQAAQRAKNEARDITSNEAEDAAEAAGKRESSNEAEDAAEDAAAAAGKSESSAQVAPEFRVLTEHPVRIGSEDPDLDPTWANGQPVVSIGEADGGLDQVGLSLPNPEDPE